MFSESEKQDLAQSAMDMYKIVARRESPVFLIHCDLFDLVLQVSPHGKQSQKVVNIQDYQNIQ